MLDLTRNKFLNEGKCIYTDGWGNKAIFKRIGDMSFESHLKFTDKNVTAEKITIHMPFKSEDDKKGTMLQLKYENGAVETEDILNTINDYTLLVQRWINMLTEISLFDPTNILKENKTQEKALKEKVLCLSKYEELQETINTVLFMTPDNIKPFYRK